MAPRSPRSPTAWAAVTALTTVTAVAAAAGTAAAQPLATERITITGRASAAVAGFGAASLADSPLQASIVGADELAETGAGAVRALTLFDAAVTDAYNAEGYWSFLGVRGFVLDNRSNYRRDGLPISAETVIGLANKDRLELLKGTSGIQSGISAPGGLANYVVKRPTARMRDARVTLESGGGHAVAVDLADRFGDSARMGLRVNAELAALRPAVRDADGRRRLLALAGDLQLSPDSRLEAEIEWSHTRQPSVPGFSLRGDLLPRASQVDPRINLNNQPWSLPGQFDGTTGSLRWRQRLGDDWQFALHAGRQALRSDDRIAFPYGCYDEATDTYYADRYCPDGRFDLYDFRSEGERRRVDALDLQFAGRTRTGPVMHDLSAGVLVSRVRERYRRQVDDYAGQGRDDGRIVVDPAAGPNDENTNRDERSTEWYLRDAMDLGNGWGLWAGLRHSRIGRESVRTDGSRPIDYTQSVTTPWLALTWRAAPATMLYTSWGQGVETDVAPNRARYTNAGEPLPALKSRQLEAGVKHDGANGAPTWSLAAFQITRPLAVDVGSCDVDASCTRRIDGDARHRGIEGTLAWRAGGWGIAGGAMLLDAERRRSQDATANGLRPVNVPRHTLKARLTRDLGLLPGLQAQLALVHEGRREVLPDNSLQAPAWTRWDAGLRGAWEAGGARWTWRVGVDNLADSRAWRDTPYQYGHSYLFPLAPRTWRASLQASL